MYSTMPGSVVTLRLFGLEALNEVGMLKSFFCGDALAGVSLEASLNQIEQVRVLLVPVIFEVGDVVGESWELQVSDLLRLVADGHLV